MTEAEAREQRRKELSESTFDFIVGMAKARAEQINRRRRVESKVKDEA
jgi:hypothetical protein